MNKNDIAVLAARLDGPELELMKTLLGSDQPRQAIVLAEIFTCFPEAKLDDDGFRGIPQPEPEEEEERTVPGRTSVHDKGRRLLTEGRLRVTHVTPVQRLIVAECKGDTGEIYALGFDPVKREWRCTCKELKGRCSHLVALQLVTALQGSEEAAA
ncbi:MAG: hypothetical protein H0U46_10850 [Actinobacteria bacterium]|nr:hypothetical protein [Actinomycetota bacterium]